MGSRRVRVSAASCLRHHARPWPCRRGLRRHADRELRRAEAGRLLRTHHHTRHGATVMAPREDDRSIGELFSELSRETAQLVRKEIELASTEMSVKAKHAGTHAAMTAVGGALV